MSSSSTSSSSSSSTLYNNNNKIKTSSLDEIFYDLSVNFLLYVVLIIVFYLVVRFYLEEDTSSPRSNGYVPVVTEDLDQKIDENTTDNIDVNKAPTTPLPVEIDDSSPKRTKRSNSFLNINEWGEPEGTKQEVIQRVFFCALGLVVSFSIWGVVQERILTQQYDDEFFTYSYGLVFLNRLGGLILSAYLMYFFKVQYINSALWEYSFPSVANMLSSWCQYEALKYVSFPTAMLAKAFKVMPVMIMGVFMHNKSYESYEYLSAALVGFGLYLFMDSSEHINFKENVFGQTESMDGAICGVVLLILFLFFDSFTGQWQTRMFQINKSMSPLQMMLIMNAFSCVFSFITLVHQEELNIALQFVYKHPEIIIHLIIFCITSTVGQLFIFYTVKNFGAVVFSIIMSLRILFSTVLSCVIYSHPITELGFLGIAIVFGAIAYRIRRKTEGKPLIRWRETEDGKRDIMHEWHEHLDV
jgi:adenosine 3'-phospho 5'-phosphosulfate transporter B2